MNNKKSATTHTHMFNLFAAMNNINSKPVIHMKFIFGLRMCLRIELGKREQLNAGGTRYFIRKGTFYDGGTKRMNGKKR